MILPRLPVLGDTPYLLTEIHGVQLQLTPAIAEVAKAFGGLGASMDEVDGIGAEVDNIDGLGASVDEIDGISAEIDNVDGFGVAVDETDGEGDC